MTQSKAEKILTGDDALALDFTEAHPMTDIVERLRHEAMPTQWARNMREAASEIERLREALTPFAKWAEGLDRDFPDEGDDVIVGGVEPDYITFAEVRAARAALSKEKP